MQRSQGERSRLDETGAAVARRLLDRAGLREVTVEETDVGDHYDPRTGAVRLTPANYSGATLTAVVVAAHEVGHALQDAEGYGPLRWRSKLVVAAAAAERIGSATMLAVPLVSALTRSPGVGLLTILVGLATLGVGVVVHFVTLPVELDASFRRALPILDETRIITPYQAPAARRILRAAALTYVAGSLASLLNVWRWLTVFRR